MRLCSYYAILDGFVFITTVTLAGHLHNSGIHDLTLLCMQSQLFKVTTESGKEFFIKAPPLQRLLNQLPQSLGVWNTAFRLKPYKTLKAQPVTELSVYRLCNITNLNISNES